MSCKVTNDSILRKKVQTINEIPNKTLPRYQCNTKLIFLIFVKVSSELQQVLLILLLLYIS